MDEHDIRLDKARRQVAEAELRVVRQKALVEDTRRQGRSTEKAEQLLAAFETSLDAMRDNLNACCTCGSASGSGRFGVESPDRGPSGKCFADTVTCSLAAGEEIDVRAPLASGCDLVRKLLAHAVQRFSPMASIALSARRKRLRGQSESPDTVGTCPRH